MLKKKIKWKIRNSSRHGRRFYYHYLRRESVWEWDKNKRKREMFGAAASSSTTAATTAANAAHAANTLNTARCAFQRNTFISPSPSSSYHSIVCGRFRFLSLRSSNAVSTKAMADSQTLAVPKHDPQSSAPGTVLAFPFPKCNLFLTKKGDCLWWLFCSLSGNKQALISLSDKKDLAFLGNGLQELG